MNLAPPLAIAAAALATAASAAPLTSESFNYTPGTPIAGQSGGSGWGGAWQADAQSATVVPGLDFGLYPTSGNALQIAQGLSDNSSGLGFAGRAFGNTVGNSDFNDRQSFMLSYLVRLDRDEGLPFGNGQVTQFGHDFSGTTVGTTSDSDRKLQARVNGSNGFGGPEGVNVSIGKQDGQGTASYAFEEGETLMAVAIYSGVNWGTFEQWASDATLYLLDEDDYAAVAASADPLSALAGNNQVSATESRSGSAFGPDGPQVSDLFRFYAGESTVTFDEIRTGTALADVIPAAIPEPGSAAGLALLGLMSLRRRR